ncbi:hypothetical protein VX037_01595 [Gordonia sp. Z-3]|jgi:hypothetical protein|uniref:Uncharacterized protein n=1 Tax=Gordonia tangerina TaxID=2911060 RepID=A0ABS9DNP7_9ACTN|nr:MULTISPECIES: hypothetical protein [Gordonia]MAU84764.1 hypothetical protein [Gordonia sp. (in: high G+C Gram-positive bacteria)]MCF3939855.1 hypothetical protein [Gordonia tangerina]MED5799728.1 hypothetical protein [Gordonia sp. Z-3]
MATHHLPHHESHGNHPMSVLGYLLVLGGFASAALWLVAMAGGNVVPAIVFGLLMIGAFAGATAIFMTLTHSHHHSPVLPDNTEAELGRYRQRYRG